MYTEFLGTWAFGTGIDFEVVSVCCVLGPLSLKAWARLGFHRFRGLGVRGLGFRGLGFWGLGVWGFRV